MSIAPSLFDKHHAMVALQTGMQHLYHGKHQLGVKTLSPHDPHYRCFYDNAYGYQGDLNVCGGWSYHNVTMNEKIHHRDPNGYGLWDL